MIVSTAKPTVTPASSQSLAGGADQSADWARMAGAG